MNGCDPLLIIIGLFFAASSTQTQSKDDEGELWRIESEIARSEQQGDTAIAKFLADDWVCACARRLSKREFVENVGHNFEAHKKQINPYAVVKKHMKVYVFRDTAFVTSSKEYRQTADTTKFFDEDDTDVFTRDASGWHLRLTKISPVPQKLSRTKKNNTAKRKEDQCLPYNGKLARTRKRGK